MQAVKKKKKEKKKPHVSNSVQQEVFESKFLI